MRIDNLHVEGFRSLYAVNFHPGDFTILVGPNNAGKSNVADAVEFLADVYREGLDYAVRRRGGLENIAHRRKRRTRRAIRFSVRAYLTPNEVTNALRRRTQGRRLHRTTGQAVVDHEFSIRATSGKIEADYEVSSESLTLWYIKQPNTTKLVTVERQLRDLRVDIGLETLETQADLRRLIGPLDQSDFIELVKRPASDELLVSYFRLNDVFWAFATSAARQKLYQLVPDECRAPGVPTPNPELERTGRNLPAVIWNMQRKSPEVWNRVLSAMQQITPAFTDISVDFSTARRIVIQFHEAGVGRPWMADEVSDGTIHSLALFVALHDPRAPVVIIEEPENSVHPWILRVVVDECRRAVTKQIVITTHSPAVLSYAKPDEVTLVWRGNGRSQVRPLTVVDPTIATRWSQGLGSVYDFLDSGYLPQAVPGGPDDAAFSE